MGRDEPVIPRNVEDTPLQRSATRRCLSKTSVSSPARRLFSRLDKSWILEHTRKSIISLLFLFRSEAAGHLIPAENKAVSPPGNCFMTHRIYSGLDRLPGGLASDTVTPGCLVLEGGALRGTYSVGVMDALMEADVNFECTIGVSAGALNGISYVSGQIGRSARSPLRYRHDPRYFGLGAFMRNRTPFGFDFMFGELSRTLDPLDMKRFFRPERRFVAVATNCFTGKPEYFEKGRCPDIMLATRASSTMPYISQMVRMNGTPYLDGGCSCKIPFRWALDNGFQAIVIVKTNPDDYRRDPAAGRTLARLFYGSKWQALSDALARSNADYNELCDEIETLRQNDRVFVISPSRSMHIARMEKDLEKLGEWYWLGYHDTQRLMPDLKAYLDRKKDTEHSMQ